MIDPPPPSIAAGATIRTRRSFIQTGAGVALAAAGASAGGLAPEASATPRLREAEQIDAGELRLFAGEFVPVGWLGCTGQELAIDAYPELAKALGGAYGDHSPGHFRVPDLRGRAVAGSGEAPGGQRYDVGRSGPGLASRHPDELPSTLALTYLISPESRAQQQLIGEVRTFGFPFAPKGWAICDGRELAVNRYNVLLAVIGIEFGGTGSETFRLPDLRSRTPLGHGDGPGLGPAPIGSHPSDLARPDVGRHPRLHVTGCIAIDGEFPRRG